MRDASPVEQKLSIVPGGKESGPSSTPPAKLLIVDDVADNRALLARRFQRRGFRITEADCGDRALELISRETFDLVLLDVMMPDLSGLEVLRQIRQKHSTVSLPVIMVTAKTQSEDIALALQLGANDYVTKPVDFVVALARVNTHLGVKRAEQQLREANEALGSANDRLERLVAYRTTKLVEANEELKQEIANRERTQAKVQYMAHHDDLTGLANRLLLREQLNDLARRGIRDGETVAVLLLDLDGFKGINDTLGHSVGDALLKCVAERLQNNARNTDQIARLGGDEFAIVQVSKDQPEGAAALADRLIEAIGAPYFIDGHNIVIGASIGIAVATPDNADTEQLLKNADLAMYRAKADGRATYCFFEAVMDARAQARRRLEVDLRKALTDGAFELYYQPILSLQTKRLTGLEALLRWRHPQRGIIAPADFIPLAEEIGLIIPLGEWVLHQACAEAATWPGDLKVAVNLSPVQFKNGTILQDVQGALAASNLPASRLELEITESVLLQRTEANLDTLNRLRDLGALISMDDFGTGYSSLSYLRSFQFDKIKIDRTFVHEMVEQEGDLAIVRAIARLGASFGIVTTAEGVETAEQLNLLKLEGCTEIQGNFLSPPLPAREIPALLTRFAHPGASTSSSARAAERMASVG